MLSPRVAKSHLDLAKEQIKAGKIDEGLKNYHRSLEIQQLTYGQDHLVIANIYSEISDVYRQQGKLEEALKYLDRSLSIKVKTLGENHPSVAKTHTNMGNILTELKRFDEAKKFYQKHLELSSWQVDENRNNNLSSSQRISLSDSQEISISTSDLEKVNSYKNLGTICEKQNNLAEALENYLHFIEAYPKIHQDTGSFVNIACKIAKIYEIRLEFEKETEFLSKCLETLKMSENPKKNFLMQIYDELSVCYHRQNKLEDSITMKKKQLEILLEMTPKNVTKIIQCQQEIADLAMSLNKSDLAVYCHITCIEMIEKEGYEDIGTLQQVYALLIKIFEQRGQFDMAISYTLKLSSIYEENDTNDEKLVYLYDNLATQYHQAQNYKDAIKSLKKCLEILPRTIENLPKISKINRKIGSFYHQQNKSDKGISHYKVAIKSLTTIQGFTSDVLDLYTDVAQILLEQHKFNLVIEDIQEALRAIPPSEENDKSILKQKSNLFYQLGISCDLLGDFDLAYESYTKAIKIQNLFKENENMLRLSISSHQRSTAAEKSFHSEGGLEEQRAENHNLDQNLESETLISDISEKYGVRSIPVSTVIYKIGEEYEMRGFIEKALQNYQQSIHIRKQLLGNKHFTLWRIYIKIGISFSKLKSYVDALASFEKAKGLLNENDRVKMIENNKLLALTFSENMNNKMAITYYQEAINLGLEIYEKNSLQIGELCESIANEYLLIGDSKNALEVFDRILYIYRLVHGDYHPDIATIYYKIGVCFIQAKNYSEAKKNLENSLKIFERLGDLNELMVGNIYEEIGEINLRQNKIDTSLLYLERALQIYNSKAHLPGSRTTEIQISLARIYLSKKKYQEGVSLLTVALQCNTPNVSQQSEILECLVNIFIKLKEYDKATRHLREFLIKENKLNFQEKAKIKLQLAFLLGKQNNFSEAVALFKDVEETYLGQYGENHPKHIEILYKIFEMLLKQNQIDQAEKIIYQILAIKKMNRNYRESSADFIKLALIAFNKNQFSQCLRYLLLGFLRIMNSKHMKIPLIIVISILIVRKNTKVSLLNVIKYFKISQILFSPFIQCNFQ